VIFSIFSHKDFSTFSDESLMLHIANGNSEAFNELYKRYGAKLYRYFYRLFNNDQRKAEDFTQDLFVKIMQSAHSFNGQNKLSTWLYTIANNMCRNEWRNQSNRNAILNSLEFESIDFQNYHQKMDQKLLQQKVEEEIQKLAENDQTIIAMRFQQELSIQEIALIINMPEGTVKSKLFYLMKKLSLKLGVYAPNYQ
jgi:RNA polymerase sigma-70 factor (ECF subfamily)